jgi:hypothetical protein
MADLTPVAPDAQAPPHSPAACPACRIADQLAEHRDTFAATWTKRRGILNFAILIAQRECPAYQRSWSEGTEPVPLSECVAEVREQIEARRG